MFWRHNNSKYEVGGYTAHSVVQHERRSVVRKNKLDQISKEVHIYNWCFDLAGVTSFIKNGRHYIACILCHDNGLIYLYDALKCKSFGKSAANAIQGQIRLLVYIHSREKDGLTGK